MILFGLTMVPLAKLTREQVIRLVQAWYAYNAAMDDKIHMIAATESIIMEKRPKQGYYIDPEKFLLIYKDTVTGANLGLLGELSFRQSDRERYVVFFNWNARAVL